MRHAFRDRNSTTMFSLLFYFSWTQNIHRISGNDVRGSQAALYALRARYSFKCKRKALQGKGHADFSITSEQMYLEHSFSISLYFSISCEFDLICFFILICVLLCYFFRKFTFVVFRSFFSFSTRSVFQT